VAPFWHAGSHNVVATVGAVVVGAAVVGEVLMLQNWPTYPAAHWQYCIPITTSHVAPFWHARSHACVATVGAAVVGNNNEFSQLAPVKSAVHLHSSTAAPNSKHDSHVPPFWHTLGFAHVLHALTAWSQFTPVYMGSQLHVAVLHVLSENTGVPCTHALPDVLQQNALSAVSA
jgi:hypothetical protein